MNILMVTSEALPFSKSGGLGDVVYSLSREYVKLKEKVSIIVPYYLHVDYTKYKELKKVDSFEVKMNWRKLNVNLYSIDHEGITYFFIDNPYYFGRNTFYGFYDDGERFAFFINAVVAFIKKHSEEFDVIHLHDWQTAMLPCLLKVRYQNENFGKIKTVLTIHNPLFKGYFSESSLFDFFELPYSLFLNGSVRLDSQVSTLKAGIRYADKITTVSKTHALELMTPEGSFGLWYDITLRKDDFCGILNGMDYAEFNPNKDKMIPFNYDNKNFIEGKSKCKNELCNKYNLDPTLPLYSIVSRLSDQKGLDLMFMMADFISYIGGNFCVLGSGERYAEDYFNSLYMRNSKHMMVYIGYSDSIAHQLYAASDFFLMPSKFEPCGLGQMIAQRYGTLPLVRETGGLKDSVIPYNRDIDNRERANGFSFKEYNVCEAIKLVGESMNLYTTNQELINNLKLNAMNTNNQWKKSAEEYLELYNTILHP